MSTIGDLFRTVPQANVAPGPSAVNSGGHQERETRVNIRGLDGTGPRSLLMVDGVRFPPQADGLCAIDPSIIPALALDRVDILADGASATYGSDAIAGVINVILKRNFDGAVTLFHFQQPDRGGQQYQFSQLYGRTWDGGDITVTYEFISEDPVKHAFQLHHELQPHGGSITKFRSAHHCAGLKPTVANRREKHWRAVNNGAGRIRCRHELQQLLFDSRRYRRQFQRPIQQRHWTDCARQCGDVDLGAAADASRRHQSD